MTWLNGLAIYLVIGAGIAWVACDHGNLACDTKWSRMYGLRVVLGWLPMAIFGALAVMLGLGPRSQ